MITKEQYLSGPCKAASIPYWKAKSITIPSGMMIRHHDEYNEAEYQQYIDEPYFRLIHDLQGLSAPMLPQGYSLCKGYGKQIVTALLNLSFELGATEVAYNCFTQNTASKQLALSCGFAYSHSEEAELMKNGAKVILDYYSIRRPNHA